MNEIQMDDMRARLRALVSAAGDPPRLPDASVIRRRVRKRRATGYTAIALAMALAGGAAVSLAAPAARPGSQAAAASKASLPRYYIDWVLLPPTVRATATGKVTAHVRCPLPAVNNLIQVVAAAHRTFFLDCLEALPGHGRSDQVSLIYRFQLTRSGRITGYHLIPGGKLTSMYAYDMATDASGSLVAVALGPNRYFAWKTSAVLLINTRTGAHRLWRGSKEQSFDPCRLALSGDGRTLAVFGSVQRRPSIRRDCASTDYQASMVRTYSLAAAGGSLNAGSAVWVSSHHSGWAARAVTVGVSREDVTLTVGFARPKDIYSVVKIVAPADRRAGIRERVIYSVRIPYPTESPMTPVLSYDPSGRFLLIAAGSQARYVNGWLDHGRLVPLRPRTQIAMEVW